MASQNQIEPDIKVASRRAATIANLIHQYVTIGLAIVNGIVLVPLYLKYIDYKLYGAWLSTGSIVAWLSIVEPGLSDIVRQQTAQVYGAKDFEQAGKAIGTGLFCITMMGLIPVLISLVIAPFLPAIFSLESELANSLSQSFVLAGAACSLVIIAGAATAVQQGLQRNISVCVIYTTGAITGLLVTVWMLVAGYGVISIPAGFVVRGIFWVFAHWSYGLYLCRWRLHIHLRLSRTHLSKIASLTGWTFFNRFSYKLLNGCDALVVGLLMGVETTPIFVLTRRAWDILTLLLERVSIAFMPGLAHLYGEGDRGKFALVARRLLRVVVYAMLAGVGLCMALNKTFVTLWVGPELYAGRMFDLAMAAAVASIVFVHTINRVLFAAEIIKGPSIAGAIQNVARAGLLILMVWLLGLPGAGLSFAIVFIAGGALYFVRRWTELLRLQNSEFHDDLLRFSKVAVISVLLSYIFGVFVVRNSWAWFVGSGAVFVLAAGTLFYMLDTHFRAEVAPFLAKLMHRFVKAGAEN